jgi:hypothetical protein
MQTERRLERSRNVTTAAVPLTEANATAFFISDGDERALCRSGTRAGRGGRYLRDALHFHFVRKSHRHRIFFRQIYGMKKSFHLCRPPSFSFCSEIEQILHFIPANSLRENVIFISGCAQDGAICSNKCAIILS